MCYIGPLQMLLSTEMAIKVEGITTWIHASHCKYVGIPVAEEEPVAEST